MEQNGKLNPSQLLRDLEENEQEIFAAGQNVSPFGNSDFFYLFPVPCSLFININQKIVLSSVTVSKYLVN